MIETEEETLKRLTSAERLGEKGNNISGACDYLVHGFKTHPVGRIRFGDIVSLLPNRYDPLGNKRLGILYFSKERTEFDLVNGPSGEIIIPRMTPVVELRIPRVSFSGNEAITTSMITRSLGLVADHIDSKSPRLEFVIGLTHPRMDNIAARRWGFLLEEHPFTQEVYSLFDTAIQDQGTDDPEVIQGLEAFRNQVLVYQTKTDFINRYKKA